MNNCEDEGSQAPTLSIPSHLSKQFPELKQLEGLVTCPICYEIALHPTSTPCHHLFCSLCIRKYLQFKQACPCCHLELHESNLRQDKRAENFIPLIVSLVQKLGKSNLQSDPNSAKARISPLKEHCSGKENQNILSTISYDAQNRLEKLACPICKVDIPKQNFEIHRKKCNESANAVKKEVQIIRKKLTPLPKLVYSLLKDSELRKKCKEFGLKSQGEKKILIGRLQKYTLLYNAEILLDQPKSKLQIAMQVEKEEKEERSGKITRPEVLQFDRNTDKVEIENKQRTYLKDNKSSFADLVAQSKAKNKPSDYNYTNKIEVDSVASDIATSIDLPTDVTAKIEDVKLEQLEEDCNEDEDFCSINYHNDRNPVKRKSSPLSNTIQRPPKKLAKGKSKAKSNKIYNITVKNETPMSPGPGQNIFSQQNIFTKLTQSAEQRKSIPKLECPVCGISVPEKFLNIHLDKCLKTSEGTSRSVSKQRTLGTKKFEINQDAESTDDEEIVDLNLSQEEDNDISVQLKPSVATREKLTRKVVKSPIIDSQVECQQGTEAQEVPVLDNSTNDSPPSSPIFDRYTETISQSQDSVNPVETYVASLERNASEKDLFESDSEEVLSTVSSNLLDDMLEEALKENDEHQEPSTSAASDSPVISQRRSRRKKESDKSSKHVTMKVVPNIRPEPEKEKSSRSQSTNSNNSDHVDTKVRTTRRRAKKLI